MWKGRFTQPTSHLVQAYGESVSFDWRLYAQDIRGSIAHSKGLLKAGILTAEEQQQIQTGLEGILKDIQDGNFQWQPQLEDVHMNIESELTRRIGPAGAKLHTARSRNDQVATDVRLYCKEASRRLSALLQDLQRALVEAAERAGETLIPGYTHLQRGQPVLFAHHLLAYVEMLERDEQRLHDALKRIDVMPLGSGALAGSTILIDRTYVAQQLGFSAITQNSMDAVSDRDFAAELLFTLALCGVHLSRLSEDVILWCSAEFGFITLSDAHTTGSSLMPQKKNPDVAELTRGKCGRLVGNLMAMLTLLKGLPMTYNRDMQEDKEPLFDSIDTLSAALAVFAEMIRGMEVQPSRCQAATADPMLLATDLADYLVNRGVPFREAHEVIGKLVAYSLAEKQPFAQIPLRQYQQFSAVFQEDLFQCLHLQTAMNARQATGAPSPAQVTLQLQRWKKALS
jgi:argininosuccinate lyase